MPELIQEGYEVSQCESIASRANKVLEQIKIGSEAQASPVIKSMILAKVMVKNMNKPLS